MKISLLTIFTLLVLTCSKNGNLLDKNFSGQSKRDVVQTPKADDRPQEELKPFGDDGAAGREEVSERRHDVARSLRTAR